MPELKHRESEQVSTRLSPSEVKQIEKLVSMGFYMNEADFVRSAVREKLAGMEIRVVRDVSVAKAKQEILKYLKKHKVAYPSDIAFELGLDLETTMSAARELWEKGRIEEAKKE